MFRAACLFPLLLAASLYAQPADPAGWTNIPWGSTLADVQALYPSAVPSADVWWTHLALPAVSISGVPFHVDVAARAGDPHVALIALWCHFGLRDDPTVAGPELFETLKALLISKYGHQKNEERKVEFGDPAHLFLWVFPTTSIQLVLRQSDRMHSLGSLHIEYRPLDPASAGVL